MRASCHRGGTGRLVAGLATLIALVLFAVPAHADYSIDKVGIDATLGQDGSLAVQETRTFDFDGSYHGVYWNIPEGTYEGRQVTPSGITAGEVVDGALQAFTQSDSGADGTYQITDRGSYVQVKIYSAHEDESVQFWITYTDENLASRWADTAELYWKFVSDGWGVESEDVTCTVHLPVPEGQSVSAGDNVRAWGHGPLDASVSFSGNDVVYTVPGVGTDEYAEARIVFPAEWLSGVTASSESRLETILSEEQQWADEANAQRTRARVLAGSLLGVVVVAAVGTLAVAILCRRDYRHTHRPAFSDRYFRDVPSADHPAVLGALLNGGKATPEGFTASLMRLTDEGLVKLEGVTTTKRGAFGRTKEESDYRITRIREPQATKGVPASSPQGCAEKVDRSTMDFLFATVLTFATRPDGEAKGGSVLFSDLKEVASSHATHYNEGYEAWEGAVEGACLERGFFTDERPTHRMLVYGMGFLDFVLAAGEFLAWCVGWASDPTLVLSLVALPIVGIVCLRIASRLMEVSPEAVELKAQLKALRRWLKDFTHLDEAVPRDVVLWDRLLVMAVVLGVSEEVIKQLKVAAPEVLDDPYIAPVYGWWYLRGPRGVAPVTAFADVAKSAHSVSTASLAGSEFSSASGGGGGFSGGGGGGFGGGGGGGAF